MRLTLWIPVLAASGALLLAPPLSSPPADEAHASGTDAAKRPASYLPAAGAKGAANETAALEIRRQQLAAREAALAIKEQELKNLAATLDARVKELEAAKASLDQSLDARKKVRNAEFQKMLKVYMSLKPAEAAGLLDKLPEAQTMEILNQMDQRHLTKLLPLIKPDRALKWTRENMAAK
ncbi:hypothetical protein [Geobacter sp.]|uniref:MotE family protein n=1 Tax=Geobacter sp. TaxID=46610 RepID=UPI0026220A94|nr:hypothetical protein [Geobacter sp.]